MWVLFPIAVVLLAYFYVQHVYKHFINRGLWVAYKKYPIWNYCFTLLLRRKNLFEISETLYKEVKESGGLGGSFAFLTPRLAIANKEYLKICTVKKFEHFMNHAIFSSDSSDENVLSNKNLFGMKDQRWKNLRTTVSPAFTANKLKILLPIIETCSQKTVEYLIKEFNKQKLENNKNILKIDLKDIFTRFTNDVIASAAFGIEVDSLNNPNNEFYLMGRKLTAFGGFKQSIKFAIFFINKPIFYMIWPQGLFDEQSLEYFRVIVEETIKIRRKEGIERQDMIHLLLEAKNKSKHLKEETKENNLGEIIELTDEDIIGQCIQFFLAGFDTISTTLSLTAYQLAEFPDVQKKLIKEVKEKKLELKENGKEFSYEFIRDMKYLEMVLTESMRRVPPLALTERKCSKRFTFEATNDHPEYTIEAGEEISIPIYGFHMDPEYYPEPEKFIPERFDHETQSVDPSVYLPFGIGPRMCIANRYAKMECKTLLYYLLNNFDIVPVEETSFPIKLTRSSFEVKPENGYIVGLRLRE